MSGNLKHFLFGFAGGTVLLLLYFGLLTALNSFEHALTQFNEMWYWIMALAAGFGIQIGLYSYVRTKIKQKSANAGKSVAAAGSVSGTSMVLCCLHHVTDVIPILGLSAAAIFLAQYQALFLFLGVLSNIVGIAMMLEIIQKHQLSEGFFKNALTFNMSKVKNRAIISSIVLFTVAFLMVGVLPGFSPTTSAQTNLSEDKASEAKAPSLNLLKQTSSQNMVTVDVTPFNFEFGKEVEFEVSLNTHSVELGFDLAQISTLSDNLGNNYDPIAWNGSPPGGHHRNGTLTFPELNENAESMVLVMKGIADVPERKFEWSLR
jgi:hypothetical protein